MSILQDPQKSLDQIEWFLDNQNLEIIPGTFFRSAGNLSRQLLEEILFIISFYGNMPKDMYMKKNQGYKLKTARNIVDSLKKVNPQTNTTYLIQASNVSPRIKKFVDLSESFEKWIYEFNEPSHFRNPATQAQTDEQNIKNFVQCMRGILDSKDCHLITAATNEILSNGKVKAVIGKDPDYTPGILQTIIIHPEDIGYNKTTNTFFYNGEKLMINVMPDDEEILITSDNHPILIQNSVGISINFQFKTEDGRPVDITSLEKIIDALAKTPNGQERITKQLEKLGLKIEWQIANGK